MTLRIYCASPLSNAHNVREHIHRRLRELGATPTSTWAETSDGNERLDAETARAAIEQNDRDLESSDVVLVVPLPNLGGETFCEMTRAIMLGIPVIYVTEQRDVLSAWRHGVARIPTLTRALSIIDDFVRDPPLLSRWRNLLTDNNIRLALTQSGMRDVASELRAIASRLAPQDPPVTPNPSP